MSAVAVTFVALVLGIAMVFLGLIGISAVLGMLPVQGKIAIGRMLYEMSNSLVPSSTSMIKIDPICWYGRGNVLYQIGQMRDKEDLHQQRSKARKLMEVILRASSGILADAKS